MLTVVPESRAFAAWRIAADRLLMLETALSTSKRGTAPETGSGRQLQDDVDKARIDSDQLYQSAYLEAQRTHRKS